MAWINTVIRIGCSVIGLIIVVVELVTGNTLFCSVGALMFIGGLSLTLYFYFSVGNIYICNEEFFELRYPRKTMLFKMDILDIENIYAARDGTLGVQFNDTIYKVNFSEENYNVLCIFVTKSKSSKITYEDMLKLKTKSIWLWN